MEAPCSGPIAAFAARFESGRAEAGRLLPMEGLRGLAVLLVFFVHYSSQLAQAFHLPLPAVGAALERIGHVGVDLFFVLSGYLIYGALIQRPRPYLGFLLRRVQRLYPTFLVVLALHLLAAMLSSSGGGLPSGMRERLLLLAANLLLLPGLFDIQGIVVVAWSLSYEMAFYLVVPLVVAGLRLRRWLPARRVALLLVVLVLMQLLEWAHRRMGMFLCGMLLVEMLGLLRERLRRAPWLDALALAALPPMAAAILAEVPPVVTDGAVCIGCFLLCAAALGRDGPVARGLRLTPLRWLGNMSYSYYLLHGFMLVLFFVALRGAGPLLQAAGEASYWALLLPALLATIAGSVPLYLFVERPFSILPAERQPAVAGAPALGKLPGEPGGLAGA
jgi:peptidoglycan/LPS O-acetylase OafA/YrhL